ncbi:MAG: hypothetical protein PHU12_02725 [Candidatus Aenigmarchaeota archaeon]|nr:hypothetical protein [Candidatus Aenigmarchaeota archaeon]
MYKTCLITNVVTQVDRDIGREHRFPLHHNGYSINGDVIIADGYFYFPDSFDHKEGIKWYPQNDIKNLLPQIEYLKKALLKLKKDNINIRNGFRLEALYSSGRKNGMVGTIIDKKELTISEVEKTAKSLVRRVANEDHEYFLRILGKNEKKVEKNWLE